MFEIGRLCVKTAGRDAGKKTVIINIIDNKYVMIDGETRRRKCNVSHLEPLKGVIKIKKDASHAEIKKEFEKLGWTVRETKPKEKAEKPKKVRKAKVKAPKEETKKKTTVKKETKTEEKTVDKPKVVKKETTEKKPAKTTKKAAAKPAKKE